jgi:transposase
LRNKAIHKLPNADAVTGFNHEYKRRGTTILFAALEVLTGKVVGGHAHRLRRRDFLAFLNELVAAFPDRELPAVLGNLKTHKPKHDRRLARHNNVHLHFTPTHASWLNQIECWFSLLSRRALRAAGFTSPRQVSEGIDRFPKADNRNATPFEWTRQGSANVHPKRCYADLRNQV